MEMKKMNDDQLNQVSGGSVLSYQAKPGDTLETIARKYHVTIEQLMRWNNIKDPNVLMIGQQIRVIF